ncbi:sensor histidine kinase [Stieleria marina]
MANVHASFSPVHSVKQSVALPARDAKQPSATVTESAIRMVSETAHDIRAPLAAVRESVRLIHDGELGELNQDQKNCLQDAIDQCNCVNQMVGEMVQLERLRNGVPRVHRQWINIATIRHGIQQTVKPWVTTRKINVIWDIQAEHDTAVFGDVSMIRRLIVNLVANAVRETPEGGSILVAVNRIASTESLQWSVVDSGRGITENEMREIAARQISHSGSEGLGLSICRQLAALHFSPLRIESRAGTGTSVSFRTAAGGPASVAERWAQWRVNQREPLRTPISRAEKRTAMTEPPNKQQIRVDAPSITIQLECEGAKPKIDDRALAGTVALGAAMPADAADAFDAFLQKQAGMFDLVYRTDTRTWVWVFDANVQQADQLIDELSAKAQSEINGIRLSWTDPQSIPLDGRRTVVQLTEMIVRNSLNTETAYANPSSDDPGEALSESDNGVTAIRLDKQLNWLSRRMSSQSTTMQAQSDRIKPKSTTGSPRPHLLPGDTMQVEEMPSNETASLRLERDVQLLTSKMRGQSRVIIDQAHRLKPPA